MLHSVKVQEPKGATGIIPKHSLSAQMGAGSLLHGPGCQEGSQCSSAGDKQAELGTLSPQQERAAFLDLAPGMLSASIGSA